MEPIERVVILGAADTGSVAREAGNESLDELAALVEAAGGEVRARLLQAIGPDRIGVGKLEEVRDAVRAHDASVVVFDGELSGARQRRWEDAVGVAVVDRTGLILDVFARRATSVEGRIQVEAAQLHYLLPRLSGRALGYSRQSGRIGTRGPGETRLETDRRHIRTRISRLEDEINRLERDRAARRERRGRAEVPVIALVGYTNVGKSTLFQQLSGRWAPAADALFVTLDPSVRRVYVPGIGGALLVDTVGFVSRLPHTLVAAFRSTLAEIRDASLIVAVENAASPRRRLERQAVADVLADLGVSQVPRLVVDNKWDLAPPGQMADGIPVAAALGQGVDALLLAIQETLQADRPLERVYMPWTAGEVLGWIMAEGEVVQESARPDGLEIAFRAPPHVVARVTRRLRATVL